MKHELGPRGRLGRRVLGTSRHADQTGTDTARSLGRHASRPRHAQIAADHENVASAPLVRIPRPRRKQ